LMVSSGYNLRELSLSFDSPCGRYVSLCQGRLFKELLKPLYGERLLLIGNGLISLGPFLEGRCPVTIIVSAPDLAAFLKERYGDKIEILIGNGEDVPFSDNDFDLSLLSSSLELARSPGRIIKEAIRVTSRRVFLGVLNKWAPSAGLVREAIFPGGRGNEARSFSVTEMATMIRGTIGEVRLEWGSQIFLPRCYARSVSPLDRMIPMMKNPCGAYLGISFPVRYTCRTVQETIRGPFEIKEARRPAPGLVREIRD